MDDEPILSASISLTDKCNLACSHCYAKGHNICKKELTTHEIFKIVDELNTMGIFSIQLSGGEPFLRSDILDICDYISKKDISIYIITNGTLITKEKLTKLSKMNIKLFQVSLDGSNRKKYKESRGFDKFKKVHTLINNAAKILAGKTALGCVLMKKNTSETYKLMNLANKIGVTFALIPLIKTGKAEHMKEQDPSHKEKIDLVNKLFKEHQSIHIDFKPIVPPAFYPDEYIEKGLFFKYCSFPYMIDIVANGDIFPCDGFRNFIEFRLGNIENTSITEVWGKSEILKNIRAIKTSDLKGVCKICKLLDVCRGGCRASAFIEYHDLKMPDPFCQKSFEMGLFPKKYLK